MTIRHLLHSVSTLCLMALSFAAVGHATDAPRLPSESELKTMSARLVPTRLTGDASHLSKGDRSALMKLLEAAQLVNQIFIDQVWSGNRAMYEKLKTDTSPLGKLRASYFWMNKGPWSELDQHALFLPGAPEKKPDGANFYPEDMTKAEFESWVAKLSPSEQEKAKGFFTVIRRDANRALTVVPYSKAYGPQLRKLSALLKEAAALTTNPSLAKFLTTRARAFLTDDYYASDVAWMDMDAPIDVTIGPYEVYQDGLFNYKAAFEAYVNLKDQKETDKLTFFSKHLQDIENHLPIDAKYRNPKLGALSPIRVVNQIIATGDGAHGIQTAAYNLPNDEKVINEKGSKRVMLKNVQEAKFNSVLRPISKLILSKDDQRALSFDWFFTHILAHELSHGIGPHQIQVNGRATTARQELKELHGAIEEAKADITGLYMLQYLMDHGTEGRLKAGVNSEHKLYTTFLASSFRTLRFGTQEAHGKSMSLQMNYLLEKKGYLAKPDGTFAVDFDKIKPAVADLTHDLMTLEATGDYAATQAFMAKFGGIRPEVQKALDRLANIPIDISPIPASLEELEQQPIRQPARVGEAKR